MDGFTPSNAIIRWTSLLTMANRRKRSKTDYDSSKPTDTAEDEPDDEMEIGRDRAASQSQTESQDPLASSTQVIRATAAPTQASNSAEPRRTLLQVNMLSPPEDVENESIPLVIDF